MSVNFVYTSESDLDSSWLNRAYYNSDTREMAVVTRDLDSYIYEDVEYARFEDLVKVKSPGSYYNRFIRGLYTNKYLSPVPAYFTKNEEKKAVAEQKKFTVRATVEFEASVTASSLDEAVKVFLESNQDVPGIKIKEVVVPFGE